MRKDMARVIVERPRLGGGGRKGRSVALEDLPQKQGMRRPHREHGTWKTLNENLAPLRRLLAGQVGRPWDKVFAEIAAGLRVDSTVQQHVRNHVGDFVAVHPQRRSGLLWRQPFYVDPRDGLLKRTDQLPEEKARRRQERARRRSTKPVERIALAEDRELRTIDGVWYELRLAPLPEAEYRAVLARQRRALKPYRRDSPTVEIQATVRRLVTPAVLDVATGTTIPVGPPVDDPALWREYRRKHPDRRYAVAKRQISGKELRKHGLANRTA